MADRIITDGMALEVLWESFHEIRTAGLGVEVLYESQPSISDTRQDFPLALARGTSGGPRFLTEILESRDGAESRNMVLAQPLWEFDVASAIRGPEDWQALRTFFFGLSGAYATFRLQWPIDDRVEDEPLGTGDGETVEFQAVKTYTAAGRTFSRYLTNLVEGTVEVKVDGTVQTEGTDHWVDYETGQVSFYSSPAEGAEITLTAQFCFLVRFAEEAVGALLDDPGNAQIEAIPLIGIPALSTAPAQAAATSSFTTFPAGDYGSSFGEEFAVQMERMPSGWESRQLLRGGESRGVMDLDYGVRALGDLQALLAWFLCHRGRAFPFRVADPEDDTATGETLTGSGTTRQLVKTYSSIVGDYQRVIRCPREGSVQISGMTEGIDFTVNYDTGELTFDSDPGEVAADFAFDVLVRMDSDELDLALDYCEIGSTTVTLREVAQ